MKDFILLLFILFLTVSPVFGSADPMVYKSIAAPSSPEAQKSIDPFNFKVDKLFASPEANSKVVFNVPIDVRLLDISPDGNWHKVSLEYSIGPAHFKHVGWSYLPVGDIFLEDTASPEPIASPNKL